MTLALAVSALAVAPAAPVEAAEGNYFCTSDTAIYYNFVFRPNAANPNPGGYLSFQSDVELALLKHCQQNGGIAGSAAYFLSMQDFEGNSDIVQIGIFSCGASTGCSLPGGGTPIPAGATRFVRSSTDTNNHGTLVVWSGAPAIDYTHEYRFSITADNAGDPNFWDLKVWDLDTGVSRTDSILKHWGADYIWHGCEVQNEMSYCGSDSDGSNLSTDNTKYKRKDNGVVSTMTNNSCNPYPATGYGGGYLSRQCSYDADKSQVQFKTQDP